MLLGFYTFTWQNRWHNRRNKYDEDDDDDERRLLEHPCLQVFIMLGTHIKAVSLLRGRGVQKNTVKEIQNKIIKPYKHLQSQGHVKNGLPLNLV